MSDDAQFPTPSESATDAVPTEHFEFSRGRRTTFLVLGLILVLGGGALLLAPILIPDSFPAARTRWQARVIGFLAFAGGGAMIYNALRYRRLSASCGPDGLKITTNDIEQNCRWNEIVTIHEIRVLNSGGDATPVVLAWLRGQHHVIVVECADGESLVFTSLLHDLKRLGSVIHQATLSSLLSIATRDLDANGSVSFGPVTIGDEGLNASYGDGASWTISWEELDSVKRNGALLVYRSGKKSPWRMVPLTEVPNAHVLLALIERYQKSNARERSA